MKPTLWTRGALSACALAATSCGMERTQSDSPPQLVEEFAAQPHALRRPAADANTAACDGIDARLRSHREDLAATSEWHDLVGTPQWSLLTDAVQRAVDAKCEFMAADDVCTPLMKRVRQAFSDLRATSAYVTAEATPEWQTLKADYADARDNTCWEQWHSADSSPRLTDPNGPINPSPNPAPNPTPVPPTNPDTGNTEPNGGEPNTQPEPQGGPINPSPNPAPNPTPVPPTNPDTGNTEGGGQ